LEFPFVFPVIHSVFYNTHKKGCEKEAGEGARAGQEGMEFFFSREEKNKKDKKTATAA
jgi:hypothetical protein